MNAETPENRIAGLEDLKNVTEVNRLKPRAEKELPLFLCRVPAGFASPAQDYIEERLDLNKKIIRHPDATYFVRVAGDSMEGARIYDEDYLVVDRSINCAHNDIILAVVNNEITVKRLHKLPGRWLLVPENKKYPPFEIHPEISFETWGKVTWIFRQAK